MHKRRFFLHKRVFFSVNILFWDSLHGISKQISQKDETPLLDIPSIVCSLILFTHINHKRSDIFFFHSINMLLLTLFMQPLPSSVFWWSGVVCMPSGVVFYLESLFYGFESMREDFIFPRWCFVSHSVLSSRESFWFWQLLLPPLRSCSLCIYQAPYLWLFSVQSCRPSVFYLEPNVDTARYLYWN